MKDKKIEVYRFLESVCEYDDLYRMSREDKLYLRENKNVVLEVMKEFDWVDGWDEVLVSFMK